jgi:hypothetical protein
MNERIDKLMYHAGLTAQGCWDEMDEYDRKAIEKFAELIVRECISICLDKERPNLYGVREVKEAINKHFGVEE